MFRKAVSLGIDPTTIIKEFHLGYAKEATCPTPPGLVGYTDQGAKPYNLTRRRQRSRSPGSPTRRSTSC